MSKLFFYLGQEIFDQLTYMFVMTNKQTKEKKMSKVKVKEEAGDTSVLSI